MPLIRIDAVAGRTPEQVKQLLDAAHRAMLTAFQVPGRDRYQVYEEHAPEHFIVEDTGLGIARTNQVIVVTVVSRPRSREEKEKSYAEAMPRIEGRLRDGSERCHGIDRDKHR